MSSVAIQGIKGSYSEEAARRLLGSDAAILECDVFDAAFAAVESKKTNFAVVPVRNKIVGEIESVSGLLNKSMLRVLDEIDIEVKHVLAGTRDAAMEEITTVRSHVEALKQCSRFIAENDRLQQVIGADTASSIRRVVSQNINTNSAIGSSRAAEMYRAKILREDIADDPENWTTFYLIAA
jgi:prephenate dehydratase